MGLSDWFLKLRKKYRDLAEWSEQQKAEELRRKMKRAKSYEPGTIRYGLAYGVSPLDFFKDSIERRKRLRAEKEAKINNVKNRPVNKNKK